MRKEMQEDQDDLASRSPPLVATKHRHHIGRREMTGARDEEAEKPAAIMTALLAKFPEFDPKWPDEIKAKWFEVFEQFMKGATT